MMLLLLSLKTRAEIVDHKFCYDRPEAEKIFQCLEMKKVYEDLQSKRTNESKVTPSAVDTANTFVNNLLYFAAGLGLGYVASEIKH
jgi:hypothetical protein